MFQVPLEEYIILEKDHRYRNCQPSFFLLYYSVSLSPAAIYAAARRNFKSPSQTDWSRFIRSSLTWSCSTESGICDGKGWGLGLSMISPGILNGLFGRWQAIELNEKRWNLWCVYKILLIVFTRSCEVEIKPLPLTSRWEYTWHHTYNKQVVAVHRMIKKCSYVDALCC